jgi:plastocyanin
VSSLRRHLAFAAVGVIVTAGTLVLSRPSQAQTAEATSFPTRVQAVADEFHYSLSRSRVPTGHVTIELANFGEDTHNFKLRRVGGTHVYTIGKTLPGARTTKTLRLRHGRFKYWCSVADHKARGMKGTLRVTRP